MWLPETAADRETLEVLAEEGVRFTLLAPGQAASVREPGGDWRPGAEALDPRRRVPLRGGAGPGARRSSSTTARSPTRSPSTDSCARARRWRRACWPASTRARTPSSSRSRPTARATAITTASARWRWRRPAPGSRRAAPRRLTNHAAFLAAHPPTMEARVVDGSSWSCAHGVERWRGDCGCRAGRHHGWTQRWRAPLREALDWLRDAVDPLYEARAGALLKDPWAARDAYVEVRPRPEPRVRGGLPRAPRAPPAGRGGPRPGAPVPRAPAPSPAHVHVVRLVLRRDLGNRDGPGAPLRGARAAARAGSSAATRGLEAELRPAPGGGPVERPRAPGRRRRVAASRGARR